MISEEDYLRRDMSRALRNTVQTLFRSRELSKRFLLREDKEAIDEEIDRISQDLVDLLLRKIRAEGLDDQEQLSEKRFAELYNTTVKEYFGGPSCSRSKAQPK